MNLLSAMALLVAMVVPTAVRLGAQQRFGDEDPILKGFTRSPSEHIINEHPGAITVRALKGTISEVAAGTGLPGALVEVRASSGASTIQAAHTDQRGRFNMRKLKEGRYIFKVTRDGFQSVFGLLVVSRAAAAEREFRISLRQGV